MFEKANQRESFSARTPMRRSLRCRGFSRSSRKGRSSSSASAHRASSLVHASRPVRERAKVMKFSKRTVTVTVRNARKPWPSSRLHTVRASPRARSSTNVASGVSISKVSCSPTDLRSRSFDTALSERPRALPKRPSPGGRTCPSPKLWPAAQAVDLSVLIQTQSRLDDHSPAPPASTLPLPLRPPPPARGREPCPATAARRVQKNDGPTQAAHDGSPLLDLAVQSLGRVEAAPRDRDPRHRPAVAAAPLPRVLDQALWPPDRRSPGRPCRRAVA